MSEQIEYTVTAMGVDGGTYVYRVRTEGVMPPMWVAQEAYRRHGQALASGDLTEPLGPKWQVTIDGMPADQWHRAAMNMG